MNLTICSDTLESLKKILQQEYEYKFSFLFGKMVRSGFVPYINSWNYHYIKEILKSKYLSIQKRVRQRSYIELCNIGFIVNHHIILSEKKEEEGEDISITVFNIGIYNLILTSSQNNYQVEIEFIQKPLNLKEILNPVKFLYDLLNFITHPVTILKETRSVIQEYNFLFGKTQDTPWIVPQGLHFLDENNLRQMRDYVVMPMRRGKKYILFLSESGAYLISKFKILFIKRSVPNSLYNTVVSGDWYENIFTAYDIVRTSNIDIRKKSFIYRMKHLRVVCTQFPFCKMVRYYRNNLDKNIEKLLKRYDGVIFSPIRANYMNNRTFLYQPVENVGIRFKLEERTKCGFRSFVLMTKACDGETEDLFTGIKELPYRSLIPLSNSDKEFIGPVNNTVFEFRWESDGFMPYMRVDENDISTGKFAKQAWAYINNPIDKNLVISFLSTFKKNICISK